MTIRVAISMGDPSGIGAEVTCKALAGFRPRQLVPYVYGDRRVLTRAAVRFGLSLPMVTMGEPLPARGALVAVTHLPPAAAKPGKPAPAGGRAQLAYLEAAFAAVGAGSADALCTAPISKAQVQRALPNFAGHTEWLEEKSGAESSVMMLAGSRLRVALVTNHLALSAVRAAVTPARIVETVRVTHQALRSDFGLRAPRIALCAMNPHAGEGGAFGDDEARVLQPALVRLRRSGIRVGGPFPSDSIFFRAARGEFDAVVALYHDQGLIPVKLIDALMADPAVNVTLGLPIVRTSPDHGVAYDLAGRGKASDSSMRAALAMATEHAARRRAGLRRSRALQRR